jgi:hypothetical protein
MLNAIAGHVRSMLLPRQILILTLAVYATLC